MQEEIEERTVAISLTAARLSARALGVCFREFLTFGKKESEHLKNKSYRGKQSVSHLMKQGEKIKTADLDPDERKEFQKKAAKYRIDYAIRKDPSRENTYILFFKAKDKKALKAFFKEYSEAVLFPEKGKKNLEVKINQIKSQMPQIRKTVEKRRELMR